MTDEAMLTELQGLLERATAAPWGAINIAGEWELTTLPLSYETPRLGSEERGRGGDDIELAAALRNAAPRLLELAQRGMEAERKELPRSPGVRPTKAVHDHRRSRQAGPAEEIQVTPLSPERLDELAAGLITQCGVLAVAEAIGDPDRVRELAPLREAMKTQNEALAAALRAGAAAWRIAVELCEYTKHGDGCLPFLGTPCVCGLLPAKQRLAALGGEAKRG